MLQGIFVSFTYIGIILFIAIFIEKSKIFSKEFSRKFIHIMVGNWVFIAFYYFDNWLSISIVPAIFVFLNYMSKKYHIVTAMERENDESWGTVWYALTLLILCAAGKFLGESSIAYVGILTMTYADGFAAIVGEKFSNSNNYLYEKKTVYGSMTIFVVTFIIVTIIDNYYYFEVDLVKSISIAVLATLLELFSKKGSDNLILPIGVSIYYLFTTIKMPSQMLIVSILTAILLIFAYFKKSLTTDGVIAAYLVGITFYALGDVSVYLSLISFFIVGSLASKFSNANKNRAIALHERGDVRNWVQVIANSLPALICLWYSLVSKNTDGLMLASILNFAAAASDTLSSEIGMLSKSKTYSILTFKEIRQGMSGGVSVYGLCGAVVGSLIISVLAIPYGFYNVAVVFVLGIVGSLIDSLYGALLQRKYIDENGSLTEKNSNKFQNYKLKSGLSFISNDTVNLLSLSTIVLIGYYIFTINH